MAESGLHRHKRNADREPLNVIDESASFSGTAVAASRRLDASIAYDATKFIRASIWESRRRSVSGLIVIAVIFCSSQFALNDHPIVTIRFPRRRNDDSFRARYSLNLLTLLALVLAIGLVVDDAIVVVKISTHMEEGCPARPALQGAREIAAP